ncbi:transmembrane protein 237A-like isoform X2 [Brienomyrus brachyistius]|uniref:transmembrane protein 237A-like isoform X2 n=1 Tax=Brienomyrus brachyistius TaxID=42636 RepID=UPI0020B23969|nr:transmembrane protein 237A-like isoform X2 [Brienomyrus brachyistius]
MDSENTKGKGRRRRDVPRLPSRQPRALPPVPSEDTGDEMRLAKTRRKKQKREASEAGDAEEPGVEMDRVTNGRQSESQEPLTPEHQEVAPHRRRKKKKMQAIDVDEDNLVNGDGEGHHTDGEELTRKNRKTKKPKMAELQYASDLDVQDDDIVTDVQAPVTQISLFSAPTGHSQPVSKVFVERSRRFQAADRFDLGGSIGQVEDYMEVRPLWSTRDVAMKVHSGFRVMGLFSHGFLAGYAVWNIITVYVLAGDQLTALPNLLQQYHMLAYPSQSLLYLLLSISIISTFDRVNLAEASAALRSFLTLDPAALSSFLYFAALILSLSQQMASDRINLYPTSNETLWPPGSELQVLQPWIVVNLVVAVLVSLAWIFISTRHDVDFTEEFLLAMDVDGCIRQEEKPEVLA